MGLVLFGVLVFPKVFRKQKKPSGKPQIPKKTKENQKYFRENRNNKVFQGFRPTIGYGFGLVWFLGFPEGFFGFLCFVLFSLMFCLVFFGFLWYLWFSRSFLLFSKNLRENQKNKQDQTHIQTQGAQGPSERGVKTAFWSQQYKIKLFVV